MKPENFAELQDLLVNAPEHQLDQPIRDIISKWDNPPKPIQVLEALDKCIFCGASTDFVVEVLYAVYDESLKIAGTTNEEVEKQALWRYQW